MSISLQKGQKVSLAKPGGGTLTRVKMGLGWDAVAKKGLFGRSKAQNIDLDASCLLFDAAGTWVVHASFQGRVSESVTLRVPEDTGITIVFPPEEPLPTP